MGEPAKNPQNLRGHRTAAEKAAKQAAWSAVSSEGEVKLTPPAGVKSSERALKCWKRTVKSLKGVKLLERADTDMLARYCLITAQVEELEILVGQLDPVGDSDAYLKMAGRLDTSNRTLLSYADKLGLTPQGRARLAVKIEKEILDADADLYGD